MHRKIHGFDSWLCLKSLPIVECGYPVGGVGVLPIFASVSPSRLAGARLTPLLHHESWKISFPVISTGDMRPKKS
jgi:hypothetical protein